MEFRLTKESDILPLSLWFTTQTQVQNWAGPLVRFPLVLEQLKKDISWSLIPSYSLLENDELVGFIQIFDRFECLHIGRVAINPTKRGKGYAIKLMHELFKVYENSNKNYSLFVYKDNLNAINLYKKLDFRVCDSMTEYENENNCLFMKK